MFDSVEIQSGDIRTRYLDIGLSGVAEYREPVRAILSFGVAAAVHVSLVLVLLGAAHFVSIHVGERSLLVD